MDPTMSRPIIHHRSPQNFVMLVCVSEYRPSPPRADRRAVEVCASFERHAPFERHLLAWRSRTQRRLRIAPRRGSGASQARAPSSAASRTARSNQGICPATPPRRSFAAEAWRQRPHAAARPPRRSAPPRPFPSAPPGARPGGSARRAPARASAPTPAGSPTAGGGTRAAGARASSSDRSSGRRSASRTDRPRRCRSEYRSKPIPFTSARW